MFFPISKVFWFFATPSNLTITLGVFGLVMGWLGLRRFGSSLVTISLVMLLVLGASPASRLMMRSLEDRFPVVTPDNLERVDGIVVLGGASQMTRGQVKLNHSAARMTMAAGLARQFPEARILFSGGDGSLIQALSDGNEGDAARALFLSLGLPDNRVTYEDKSRNTRENAVYSLREAAPKPGERWLLLTSAFHMPRSVGVFRKAGFEVIPFPVDFYSKGDGSDWRPFDTMSGGLRLADLAAREWVGLLGYHLAGYTDTLLPGPK